MRAYYVKSIEKNKFGTKVTLVKILFDVILDFKYSTCVYASTKISFPKLILILKFFFILRNKNKHIRGRCTKDVIP